MPINNQNKDDQSELSEQEWMAEVILTMDQLFHSPFLKKQDKETMEKIIKDIAILQNTLKEANRAETEILKKQVLKERKSIKKSLNTLSLFNNEEMKFRTTIIENLKKLEGQVKFTTEFDDDRIHQAKKSVKKETGANPGYTVTNAENTRFTVKQGSTVGNTLSEVFSSMVLSEIIQASGTEDTSQVMIANAFLVVKNLEDKDKGATLEERCKKRLYAASQWSNDRASFEACQLLGFKKRKKGAGTRQVQEFEDLRQLNAACNLGLEKIVIPTALIADFDLHAENFMLKINDLKVKEEHKKQVSVHLDLLKELMENTSGLSRKFRMDSLIVNIKVLKELGVNVFFHKIDHDSGFYRYADPRRVVDFLTHRTSPIHREGMFFKTQPTLHLTEMTGGTKEGMDQLLLSKDGIERLVNISLDKELDIVSRTAGKFFQMIHEKSEVLEGAAGTNNVKQRSAEFYLLNEFYHHIKEKRMPTPKVVTELDIAKLKTEILQQLKLGTKLKVTDLHSQVYKRLLEKENKKEALTGNQLRLRKFLETEGKDYLKGLIPENSKVSRFSLGRR